MGDVGGVTELDQAFGAGGAQPSSSAGNTATTETPLGSTKGNFWGKEKAPLAAMNAANQDVIGAQKEAGENQISRAVLGEEQAGAEGAQAQANVNELTALKDQHNAEIQRLLVEHQPMIDAADKFKFHDYFADGHTGNAILAAISSAMLGFGTGQYHNVAMEIAKADHERQVNEFSGLMERARFAGASEDRLMKIHEAGLTNLQIMQAAKYKAIADKYAQMGTQATTVEQQTAAKMGNAIAMKKAAAEMEDIYKGVRTRAARNVSHRISQPQGALP